MTARECKIISLLMNNTHVPYVLYSTYVGLWNFFSFEVPTMTDDHCRDKAFVLLETFRIEPLTQPHRQCTVSPISFAAQTCLHQSQQPNLNGRVPMVSSSPGNELRKPSVVPARKSASWLFMVGWITVPRLMHLRMG